MVSIDLGARGGVVGILYYCSATCKVTVCFVMTQHISRMTTVSI